MLIRFTVSNFLSFKDETEFNMLTGDVKRHPHHVYKREHIDVLRAAAIYGANGAGKSNLIKAIAFIKKIISGDDILSMYQKFKLSKEYLDKPSELEVEFIINQVLFSYGVIFDHKRIAEEWLYKIDVNDSDEIIFERKTDMNEVHKLTINKKYLQTEKDKYFVEFYEKELLTINKSFISTTKNDHFEEIQVIKKWFQANVTLINPTTRPLGIYSKVFQTDRLKDLFSEMIAQFNTGIESIGFRKEEFNDESAIKLLGQMRFDSLKNSAKKTIVQTAANKNVIIYSCEDGIIYKNELIGLHNSIDGLVEFLLDEESDGTIRILDFISIIFDIRDSDKVFIIDEIDRSIHPALLKTFIKKLMEMLTSKGQIIFTTHESNLLDLDIFRQDEIWFAEKNKEGATQFYSLSDFKPRYDLDIRKGYLNGRFGAIPFLGDLEKLNWNNHAETK
jgi:uncharacterized protein